MKIAVAVFAAGALFAQVSFDRIVTAEKDPGNWLTYSGNSLGTAFRR